MDQYRVRVKGPCKNMLASTLISLFVTMVRASASQSQLKGLGLISLSSLTKRLTASLLDVQH